jgi:peptide/nickel transport system ATP-binding protein
MVLKNGALVEEAPTRQMVVEPKAAYTQTLWAVRELEKEPRRPQGIALSVKNLSARYPRTDVQVLSDISVDLAKGCTTAVVGESGSGKTTLGRTICGLLPPESGSISFAGRTLPPRLGDRDRLLLRELQLVHQSADTALNPRQPIRKILSRPIEYFTEKHGLERDRRIAELLDLVELPVSMVDRLPGQLSGGQKQRINLARALAAEPRIIVCDEVTSALDQVVQKGILELLLKIQKQTDMTYMFITHDIATVRAIADHVVVMYRGKVVEQGSKEAVLANPAHDYTKLLMSSVPNIDPDWLDGLLTLRSGAGRNGEATKGDDRGG